MSSKCALDEELDHVEHPVMMDSATLEQKRALQRERHDMRKRETRERLALLADHTRQFSAELADLQARCAAGAPGHRWQVSGLPFDLFYRQPDFCVWCDAHRPDEA